LVRRSADYCNAQLVYYTFVESYGKEVHGSLGDVAANRLSLWQSTGKQLLRLSPICTSSATDKDNDKRHRAAIVIERKVWEIAAIGDLRWMDRLHQRRYRGRGGCVRGVVVEAFGFALDAVRAKTP
jgi:hypothetical protein